ncbi:MAG: intermembrane transport protein PqiB, partial [Myxococcota bacterium]
MTDAHAAVSQKRGINPIWFVPVIALLLGISMVVYTIQQEGPEITIRFVTAEGIVEGKTKLKLRDVDIGVVEDVHLTDDAENVVVVASLENEAESLLRSDTQFWVVRPRIGKTGVSGLSTLLSGGYIQLVPGRESTPERDFVGLEEPPVTPAGTPGMRIVLTAERAGSIGAGDPVLYKGYTVGQVEKETPKPEEQYIEYDVFIKAPYYEFLTVSHRFWDVSGITASAGPDGIDIKVESLETVLIGGVEVGLPEGITGSAPVEAGHRFQLYTSFSHVNQRPYRAHTYYVMEFAQSVRGLSPGAPVEYRGIRIGEVVRVMVSELSENTDGRGRDIPVFVFHDVVPETFESQLRYLSDNAFSTVTADELA